MNPRPKLKGYTIFKLPRSPQGKFYYRITHPVLDRLGRKPFMRAGSFDRDEAERMAVDALRILHEEADAIEAPEGSDPEEYECGGESLEGVRTRIGTLIRAYEADRIFRLGGANKAANVSALVNVVATVAGLPTSQSPAVMARARKVVCNMPVRFLCKRFGPARLTLIEEFMQRRLGYLDFSRADKRHTTVNSTIGKAMSVLSQTACSRLYSRYKLPEFYHLWSWQRLKETPHYYMPLPNAVLAEMEEAAEKLKAETDELWLVNRLHLASGLRNNELLRASSDWVLEHEGRVFLDLRPRHTAHGMTKLAKGLPRIVPLVGELGEIILHRANHAKKTGTEMPLLGPLLPEDERFELCNQRYNAWLKALPSWPKDGDNKVSYRLRKHVASVLFTHHGLHAAMVYCGHTTPTMTLRHYATLLKPTVAIDFDEKGGMDISEAVATKVNAPSSVLDILPTPLATTNPIMKQP